MYVKRKYFVFFGAKIELQIRTMDSSEVDRIGQAKNNARTMRRNTANRLRKVELKLKPMEFQCLFMYNTYEHTGQIKLNKILYLRNFLK